MGAWIGVEHAPACVEYHKIFNIAVELEPEATYKCCLGQILAVQILFLERTANTGSGMLASAVRLAP